MTDFLVNPSAMLRSGAEGAVELLDARSPTSKVFFRPDDTCDLVAVQNQVHYWDDGWQEIFLGVPDSGIVTRAPYDLQIFTDRVGYQYVSKRGGKVVVELDRIGDAVPDASRFAVRTMANQLFWDDVADGIDMKIQLGSRSAEIFKRLDEGAVRKLRWKVHETPGAFASFQRDSAGFDREAHRLEVLSRVSKISEAEFFLEEEWTGRIAVRDPKTRQKRWSWDAAYPIIIDAVTTENIAANVDDGFSNVGGTTWVSAWNNWQAGAWTWGTGHGGVRFRTLAIPQGATINTATLTFIVTNVTGAPGTEIYGDDVNDAALWANGNLPGGITKTAASTVWSPGGAGTSTVNVTGIVQEIISRPGWVSNNDIRFGILNQLPGTANNHLAVRDYNSIGPGGAAVLTVNFTPAGAARTMHHYRKRRSKN